MSREKDFPRYDDLQHIDSNAVAPRSNKFIPRVEPNMLSYTEMYCEPGASIDLGTFENKKY